MAAAAPLRSSVKTLLVRLPNPVGDVVMTTPLLEVLRREMPGTAIVLAGNGHFGELLAGLDTFDRFLPFPSGRIKPSLGVQSRWLKQANADAVLLLPNSWSSALVARIAGIPHRIGRRAHGRSLLLNHKLPPVGPARAMTGIYLEMLAPLGIEIPTEADAPRPRLVTGDVEAEFLGVAPGAAFGESKIYPLEMLAEAVSLFHQQSGLPALLIGSPAEESLLENASEELQQRNIPHRVAPSGGFGSAKCNIKSCRALLTMDSGARHIAAALGVPQVAIYGPTHPGWSAHSLDSTTILRAEDVDCLGCHHKECPIDHRCMTRLQPQTVADALRKL
jgi:heptosyltransferase II